MRFTNSPYEDFMKEKSYFKGVPPNLPPKGSRCDGCPYLAKHTGRDVEKIRKDIEVDTFLTAPEAKEYGIVDEVLRKPNATTSVNAAARSSATAKSPTKAPERIESAWCRPSPSSLDWRRRP